MGDGGNIVVKLILHQNHEDVKFTREEVMAKVKKKLQ